MSSLHRITAVVAAALVLGGCAGRTVDSTTVDASPFPSEVTECVMGLMESEGISSLEASERCVDS